MMAEADTYNCRLAWCSTCRHDTYVDHNGCCSICGKATMEPLPGDAAKERRRVALHRLRRMFPNEGVNDHPKDPASKVLDLVEQDVLWVPDPAMTTSYAPRTSTGYDESIRFDVWKAVDDMFKAKTGL